LKEARVARENRTGSLRGTRQRDRDVAPPFGEHEALLDHHIEEMLVAFSDLPRMHENAPRDAEPSID
jgi:hypothetical protein